MQGYGDAVGANLSPFTGVAAVAKVFHIHGILDDHGGAVGAIGSLDHAAEEWGRPIGTGDLSLFEIGAGAFHHIPAGDVVQERLSKYNGHRENMPEKSCQRKHNTTWGNFSKDEWGQWDFACVSAY